MSPFDKLSLFIASAGVLTAAIGLKYVYLGLQANTKQQKATVFIEYAKRFNDILDDLGGDTLDLFGKIKLSAKDKKRLELFCGRYLALLHQEHFLWKTGSIDANIWRIWIGFAKIYLNSPIFQSYWGQCKNSMLYSDPEFAKFVGEQIGQLKRSSLQLQPELT